MTTSPANLTASAALRTPLYKRHVALGGRMVDFGGWELPQQYTSIRDEHLAVRQVAGLFDISHMGRFRVTGDSSFEFLQGLLTNDLSRIGYGRAQYNLMCNEAGGILDDLPYFGFRPGVVAGVDSLVSRTGYTGEDGFEIFVSADQVERVWDAILEKGAHAGALPAGLGARDATRLEAALRLYGNDMDT